MTTELWTVGEARPLGAIPRDRAWHEAGRSDTRDMLFTLIHLLRPRPTETTTCKGRSEHPRGNMTIGHTKE